MPFWLALVIGATPVHLVMLHTGDGYSYLDARPARFFNPEFPPPIGGLDALRRAIHDVEKEGLPMLLLDTGNGGAGDLMGRDARWREMADFFNEMGYTAVGVGTRDLALGRDTLTAYARRLRVPLLAANLRLQETGMSPDWLLTDTLVEVQGVRIGIFALVSEYAGIYNTSAAIAPWLVDRELEVARKKVKDLRQRGADLVVVLSNMGYTHERRLAREVEGIDVILGGFDFPGLREPFVDPEHHTLIVRPYTGFSNVGRLDLWVDPEVGGIYRYTYRNLSLLLDDFPPEEPARRP